MSDVENVEVRTASGEYEVRIGAGLLAGTGALIARLVEPRRVAIVTDTTVGPLFGDSIAASLEEAGIAPHRIMVSVGEASKRWEVAGRVLEDLTEAGLDRADAVVALGGGVVGDLAGFCASTYMRGIPYLQIPTTLLAQVDSSVGGKTGVDLPAGKNLAGSFWQPVAVIADTDTLDSLPDSRWSDGIAEIVKAGFILGDDLLPWLEEHMTALRSREAKTVRQTVRAAVAFKADVVASDEREAGVRECLNLGHTLAHAIEKVEGYSGLSHGAAVAQGLRFAAFLAQRLGLAEPSWTERQARLMEAAGLPAPHLLHETDALVRAMHADKKARSGTIRFVLSKGPGSWEVVPVADDVLAESLGLWKSGAEEA